MTSNRAPPLAAILAALALSACSSEPEATDTGSGQDNNATAGPAVPEEADSPQQVATIPAAMLGTWDYVGGTCDSASDLRLEMQPDQLLFYESMGEVRSVTLNGDDVTIALAMMGEGEEWDEELTFRLVEGGTLLESEMPAPGGEGLLRRKRCDN